MLVYNDYHCKNHKSKISIAVLYNNLDSMTLYMSYRYHKLQQQLNYVLFMFADVQIEEV